MKLNFKRINYDKLLELFGYTEEEGFEFVEELAVRHIRELLLRAQEAATRHKALEAKMKYEKKDVEASLRESWETEIKSHHRRALVNEELEDRLEQLLLN